MPQGSWRFELTPLTGMFVFMHDDRQGYPETTCRFSLLTLCFKKSTTASFHLLNLHDFDRGQPLFSRGQATGTTQMYWWRTVRVMTDSAFVYFFCVGAFNGWQRYIRKKNEQ